MCYIVIYTPLYIQFLYYTLHCKVKISVGENFGEFGKTIKLYSPIVYQAISKIHLSKSINHQHFPLQNSEMIDLPNKNFALYDIQSYIHLTIIIITDDN